jgi:hypothetical protein
MVLFIYKGKAIFKDWSILSVEMYKLYILERENKISLEKVQFHLGIKLWICIFATLN